MAINENLQDSLNACIDRLNAGESLDSILQDYPTTEKFLRPMLEAGLLAPKAHVPASEVAAARQQLDGQIQETIDAHFTGGYGMGWLSGLFVLLLLAGILIAIMQLRTTPAVNVASKTPPPTVTLTHTPETLPLPTAQPLSASPEPITIIEGPISKVNDGAITIYDQIISVDDPRLQGLQPGDVIRLERRTDASGQSTLTLTLATITILVNTDGQFWRDDDCSISPPSWAANNDETADWYARCTTSPPSQPRPSGSKDNDDDD